MYEHPMKRAGISMSRILYSNTRMVQNGFPKTRDSKMNKFDLGFKFRTYNMGKVTSTKSKYLFLLFSILTDLVLVVFSNEDMDEAFPPKHVQAWATLNVAILNSYNTSLNPNLFHVLGFYSAANRKELELQKISLKLKVCLTSIIYLITT